MLTIATNKEIGEYARQTLTAVHSLKYKENTLLEVEEFLDCRRTSWMTHLIDVDVCSLIRDFLENHKVYILIVNSLDLPRPITTLRELNNLLNSRHMVDSLYARVHRKKNSISVFYNGEESGFGFSSKADLTDIIPVYFQLTSPFSMLVNRKELTDKLKELHKNCKPL